MKILFAVSNENISNAIVKNYQKKYNDAVTFKNVFYFNAITKELQKDKFYDCIVISEDLEPFSNSNYDVIDKFILGRLESISFVANEIEEKPIPIILICTDRRTRSGEMLSKFYDLKIYNALIGGDRKIDEVCKLIANSRTKEEAQKYYNLQSDDSESIGADDVSELEVQNILIHYRRLGNNEEKYVESFNNIASQYTDNQLKIIIRYLPIKVKAVLESDCPKYQELVVNSAQIESNREQKAKEKEKEKRQREKFEQEQLLREKIAKEQKQKEKQNSILNRKNKNEDNEIDLLKNKMNEPKLSSQVIIPSSINTRNEKKLYTEEEITQKENMTIKPMQNNVEDIIYEESQEEIEPEVQEEVQPEIQEIQEPIQKKGRGRPRKNPIPTEPKPKGKRGRPRKNPIPEENINTDISDNETIQTLPDIDDFEEIESNEKLEGLPGFEELEENTLLQGDEDLKENGADALLPGFEDIEENDEKSQLPGFEEFDDDVNEQIENIDSNDEILTGVAEDIIPNNNFARQNINETEVKTTNSYSNNVKREEIRKIEENRVYSTGNLNSVLTTDKKIVAFVGTSKNGTSFLVNNLASLFSSIGINTAILDVTQNKNAYYIYTDNNEELRKIAYTSIEKLENGVAEGIKADRNLTVYTSVPNEETDITNSEAILSTLARNHSLVLIDCDYSTDYGYFANSQEIYLVQSMDVLTIQPLTTFLRELKTRGILDPQKLRAVINKEVKIRGVNSKTIIGGMSCYNDPSMSFMTELFNKDKIRACTIPFDISVYSKYLETLITCKVTISGYSKNFINSLKILGNMVYPLMSKQTYLKSGPDYSGSNFSDEMNNTLNQMKRKY